MNTGIVRANILPDESERQVANKGGDLGRNDFLKLLITQLRYQNPSKPMSNEAFIAQSAQFSSLEKMADISENIKALLDLQKSSNKIDALNLIGKKVVAQQSTISLLDNSPVDLTYSLSADASVSVTIHNANGEIIGTIDTGDQLVGDHTYSWDGRNENGIRMPPGEYTYQISAVDPDGNDVGASGIISGIVDGLIFENRNEPYVSIGGTRVPLADVTEVLLNATEILGENTES